MKLETVCNLCKLNNEKHFDSMVLTNDPSNKYYYYLLFEFPFNATAYIQHYLKQLRNYNVILTYAVSCKKENYIPTISDVNKCMNILNDYITKYKPIKFLAFGPLAIASLKRYYKLDIDEKNLDYDEIYYANDIPILLTYNPLMYFKSKNAELLNHIHLKLEELFDTKLEKFTYYNQQKINSVITYMQNVNAYDIDLEIDLNDYDIQLCYTDKYHTYFKLYKSDNSYKYLKLDNVAILQSTKNLQSIKELNTYKFAKVKKYKGIYATDNKLKDVIDIYKTIDVYGINFSAELMYALLNKNANNKAFYEPKYLVVDIEVISDKFPDPNIADDPIICLTIYQDGNYYTYYANTDKEIEHNEIPYVKKFNTEKELLEYVWNEHIAKATILLGWNAYFDIIYLWNRAYKLGIDVITDVYNFHDPLNSIKIQFSQNMIVSSICKQPFFTVYDLLDIYESYVSNKEPSVALDYIAKKELGYEKVKLEESIKALWLKQPEIILYYNYIDTKLTTEILHKYNFIKFFDEIRRVIDMPLNYHNYTPTKYGIYVMFNNMLKNNIIASYTETLAGSFNIQYTGAYVQQPVPVLITKND